MNPVIDDARVLLELLGNSPWLTLHVRTNAAEIFIARSGGAPNPMRDAPVAARASNRVAIKAPHVGTILSTVAVDEAVGTGDVIACLDLLGERVEIVSPDSGVVDCVFVREGDFVEYDKILLTFVRSPSAATVIQPPLPAS